MLHSQSLGIKSHEQDPGPVAEHFPALGRQRQEDHCSFEASLGYLANFRPACDLEQQQTIKQQGNKDRNKNQTVDRSNLHHFPGLHYRAILTASVPCRGSPFNHQVIWQRGNEWWAAGCKMALIKSPCNSLET